jgi:hypothetical protein
VFIILTAAGLIIGGIFFLSRKNQSNTTPITKVAPKEVVEKQSYKSETPTVPSKEVTREMVQQALNNLLNPAYVASPPAKQEDPTNQLILYESGHRVHDSSILVVGENNNVCKSGICSMQVIHEPVKLTKAKEKTVLDYGQWINYKYLTTEGCEGYAIYEEEISSGMSDWLKTDTHKSFVERVDKAQTTEERQLIWKEEEPLENAYLERLGLNFIGKKACPYSRDEYDDVYLKNILANKLYEVVINLPVQKIIERDCSKNNCSEIPMTGIHFEEGGVYKVDILAKKYKKITNLINLENY